MPTPSPSGHERSSGILCQPRLPRPQKGQGARCIGRLQREVDHSYYGLDHIPPGPFAQLREHPDYHEVIRVLTKGQGEWRINSAGHAVNFKAKHLAYIPKVWHHFITSRLIPTTNVCEVTAQRSLLNYAILQNIPFDVGQVIEDAILHNRDAKMNLGHPFLIFGLCKQAGVPLDTNEAWLHPIKTISVKRDTPGVPAA